MWQNRIFLVLCGQWSYNAILCEPFLNNGYTQAKKETAYNRIKSTAIRLPKD